MNPRRLMVIAVLACAVVTAGACGGDNSDDPVATDSTEESAAETTASETETSAPGDDGDETTASEEASTSDVPAKTTESDNSMAQHSMQAYVLRGLGIGPLGFGDSDEEVVAAIEALLGPVTSDTGWETSPSPCDEEGAQARSVQFGDLYLDFIDGVDEFGTGRHWRAYVMSSPEEPASPMTDFATAEGVEVGMKLSDAQILDPSIESFDSEIQGRAWSAGPVGENGVYGSLQSDGTDERIGSISAGLLCID